MLRRSVWLLLALVVALMLTSGQPPSAEAQGPVGRKPTVLRLNRARAYRGDLRRLPASSNPKFEIPEREDPDNNAALYPGTIGVPERPTRAPGPHAPAPAPGVSFDGLPFIPWGVGHPGDTNGDVGPTYYIQTINSSIGIFNKTGGTVVPPVTFNTFMSQGAFGNLCDTDNFGDPVVLYDSFEDRWIITDFAFQLSSGAVVNPPGSFECIAASASGDPVSGGWNFYSINTAGGLGDYPKFGIWPDGLYMSTNMFAYQALGPFQNARVYAFNKAQMYAGAPAVQSVSFDAPSADFTLLPSNARLQTGTPPAGTPNFFVSTWQFLNAVGVYKFHVDWVRTSLSTFTGPDTSLNATSWPNATVPNALTPSALNPLDVLQLRAMVQNQYSNIGGAASLWVAHTVRRANTSGIAAPRWYQLNVTGGTVAANTVQGTTWDPDGANTFSRFMPSLAVDRMGDMALGYSKSNASTNPQIKYAGRLAADPVNTFSQDEQTLIDGTGTQTGNCGASACIRWGDYSAMTLDPDGCTFWYTSEYYAVSGLNYNTRIGSFAFPSCTPVGGGGAVQGTVTNAGDSLPISGALVQFGSRTATTNGSGFYQFPAIPAGTYTGIGASDPGFNSGSSAPVLVTDGGTTTKDFALTSAPANACPTDTTQSDFQTGLFNNVDLNASPGDVVLVNAPTIDQQNTAGTTTGTSFATTSWGGQTFIPSLSGQLTRVDVQLFCSGCTGTTPNLTLSIRNTSGGLPTGADLATATITGFNNGAGVYYLASFGSPATVTSGTQYALVLRPVAAPSVGGYFWIRASPSSYANGQRVISTDNGVTWTADSTRDFNFKTYIFTGYTASGDFASAPKDANAFGNFVTSWTTLSWTSAVTPGVSLAFQAAASNNPYGPFNFVGPDGTPGTFYTTSGSSLSQFNTLRYLKYKAYLATTDSSMTPVLNDVAVCFTNNSPTAVGLDNFAVQSHPSSAFPADGAAAGLLVLLGALLAGVAAWRIWRAPQTPLPGDGSTPPAQH